MIHVILGLKGSGKTKKLIDAVHQAVDTAAGDVVCIEYGKTLTYDLNYRVRLVDAKEYGINSPDQLKGFLSGCTPVISTLHMFSLTICTRPSTSPWTAVWRWWTSSCPGLPASQKSTA